MDLSNHLWVIFVPVVGCLLLKPWPGQRLAMLTGLSLAFALGWVCYLLVLPTYGAGLAAIVLCQILFPAKVYRGIANAVIRADDRLGTRLFRQPAPSATTTSSDRA